MSENKTIDEKIIEKISSSPKKSYVIFFVYGCPYCENSLALLKQKNVPFKGYNINDIDGGMFKLLEVLNKNASIIGFNSDHRTKPIIFYDGKFIGGYTELTKHLK